MIGRWVLGLVSFVALSDTADTPVAAAEPPIAIDPEPDCGTIALFNLLRFIGQDATLDEVKSTLEAHPPGGFSLEELREGARRLGAELVGVRMDQVDGAPDRPILAYVDRDGHGHFLVVRPVGHTGKLLQVLDGVQPPEVMDASTLQAMPSWTGLSLAPVRSDWLSSANLALTLAAALLLVVWIIPRTCRRIRMSTGPRP